MAQPGLGFQSNYLPPFSCQKNLLHFWLLTELFLPSWLSTLSFFPVALNWITPELVMAMMALDAAKSVSLETRLMYSLLQIEARPPVLLVGWGITIRSNFVHVHFHNFHQYQNIFNYAPSLFCFFSPHSSVLLFLESFVPFYSLFNAPLLCKR